MSPTELSAWWQEAQDHAAPNRAAHAIVAYVRENGEAGLDELRQLLADEGVPEADHLPLLAGMVAAGLLRESDTEADLRYLPGDPVQAQQLSLSRKLSEAVDDLHAATEALARAPAQLSAEGPDVPALRGDPIKIDVTRNQAGAPLQIIEHYKTGRLVKTVVRDDAGRMESVRVRWEAKQ